MDCADERRQAELEVLSAIYLQEEAQVVSSDPDIKIRRRLITEAPESVSFLLDLTLSPLYLLTDALQISGSVDDGQSSSIAIKAAYNALPNLIEQCRKVAQSMIGEEAVCCILNEADIWLADEWPKYKVSAAMREPVEVEHARTKEPLFLCRNLIYSHHIIGNKKRADMKSLGADLELTGYVKIGWPGIIIVEGDDTSVRSFYDTVRRWQWQYIVLRGEMEEAVLSKEDLNSKRKFDNFEEIDDMSIAAAHCRRVGLESLFLTSMKRYFTANTDSEAEINDGSNDANKIHGALIHIDHMNNAKEYRKWLRKTCNDLDVAILIKQCYPNDDYSKRPLILVGLVGDQACISSVMKRWRLSKVDVDSKGKPCLERMMHMLVQEELLNTNATVICWDEMHAEKQLNTEKEKLKGLLLSIGGQPWVEAYNTLRP